MVIAVVGINHRAAHSIIIIIMETSGAVADKEDSSHSRERRADIGRRRMVGYR